MNGKIGHWAFLIGIFLTILVAFIPTMQTSKIAWVLVTLGLIVGFLNITGRESSEFLIAVIALVIAANIGSNLIMLPVWFTLILTNIVLFVFPAALIVALKTVWVLASS